GIEMGSHGVLGLLKLPRWILIVVFIWGNWVALSAANSGSTAVDRQDDWLATGKALLQAGEDRQAYEAFERAALQYPDSFAPYLYMGILQARWGMLQSALLSLKVAQQDSSLFVLASTEIAGIYRLLGNDQAETAVWEALFSFLKRNDEKTLPSSDSSDALKTTTALDEPAKSSKQFILRRTLAFRKPMDYIFSTLILLLCLSTVLLHRQQRRLQRQWADFNAPKGSDPPEDVYSQSESPPSSKIESSAAPPSGGFEVHAVKRATETEGSEADFVKFTNGENHPVQHSRTYDPPIVDSARKVVVLHDAGLSVQEIAEKLDLGQDEVRLILNLQREAKDQTADPVV
ncbi:MAG: tetratricopeptide repeat protein, partial [bacterium]